MFIKKFAVTAVAVGLLSAVVLVGCGSDGDDDDGHTHTWGEWVVTTPATCDAPGERMRRCTEDTSHTETQTISKLTGAQCETSPTDCQQWGSWTVTSPATCDAAGVETKSCTQQGTTTTADSTRAIPKLTGAQCESGSVELDPALLNTSWTRTVVAGTTATWVFTQEDGMPIAKYIVIASPSDPYNSSHSDTSTWRTENNNLLIITYASGSEEDMSYTISGNELTLSGVKFTRDDDIGGGGGDVQRDSRLVTADGQAWVGTMPAGCYDDEDGDGEEYCYPETEVAFILSSNGTRTTYAKFLGTWMTEASDIWYTSGNRVYSIYEEEGYADTSFMYFTVSGNTLTLTDPDDPSDVMTLTKQSWSPPEEVELDPALINTAWMRTLESGTTAAWTFMQEEGIPIAMYMVIETQTMETYLWSTEPNQLVLTPFDLETLTITGGWHKRYYTISGDVLTIAGAAFTKIDIGDGLFKSRTPKIQTPKLKIPKVFR